MTIEVPCCGCGQKLQVAPEHAGKMARCPVCGHITPVPAGNGNQDPILAAPSPSPVDVPADWYMRTPEGQEYGPASKAELDRWVAEGRITADCQLRSGMMQPWQSADRVFPELKPPAPAPVWVPPPTTVFQAAQQPTSSAPPAPMYVGNYSPHGSAGPMATSTYLVQHRGGLILLLGLLGIVLQPCPGPIFAIAAWVMGSNDLREMDAGRMDRSGMDLTRAGMIMGMIISVLWVLGLLAIGGIIFLAAMSN